MAFQNPGIRLPTEFSFEAYVERQFCLIHERLGAEMVDIAGLQADADTLANVIPELASALTTQAQALGTKEEELRTALAAEGAEKDTVTRLEGELAQVEAIKQQLDPVASQASGLVAGGATPPPPEAPAATPETPPEAAPPEAPTT